MQHRFEIMKLEFKKSAMLAVALSALASTADANFGSMMGGMGSMLSGGTGQPSMMGSMLSGGTVQPSVTGSMTGGSRGQPSMMGSMLSGGTVQPSVTGGSTGQSSMLGVGTGGQQPSTTSAGKIGQQQGMMSGQSEPLNPAELGQIEQQFGVFPVPNMPGYYMHKSVVNQQGAWQNQNVQQQGAWSNQNGQQQWPQGAWSNQNGQQQGQQGVWSNQNGQQQGQQGAWSNQNGQQQWQQGAWPNQNGQQQWQ